MLQLIINTYEHTCNVHMLFGIPVVLAPGWRGKCNVKPSYDPY